MIVQFPPTQVTADATSINTNGLISFAFNSTSNSNTTLTINKPSGTKQGDVMFAFLNITIPNVTLNAPPGWIILQTTAIDNAGNNKDFGKYTYYKVAGAVEPASYTWAFINPTKAVGGIVSVTAAPGYTIFSTKADYPGSAQNILAPNVTTAVNSTLVIESFASASGKDLFTDPVSWARLWEAQTSGASGATESVVVKFFRNALSSTGVVTETTTESVPRSVHIIAIPLRYEVVVTLNLTATASTSHVALVNNIFAQKSLSSAASTFAVSQVIRFFEPTTISASATSSAVSLVNNVMQEEALYATASIPDVLALVNNEDSASAGPYATAEILETSVIKNTSFNESFASSVLNDLSSLVNNVAEGIIAAEALTSNAAVVNNVFQPGAVALGNTTTTINTLINGQGSALSIALADTVLSSLVNNVSELSTSTMTGALLPSTSTYKIVGPDTVCEAAATTSFTATAINEFGDEVLTSQAEANIADIILIRTVSPNVILGIGETTLLNGSTRLPSQSGLGVTVDPVNANLNVNIIRIL